MLITFEDGEPNRSYGSLLFVGNQNMIFETFIMWPMGDDFLWWKGMPGDAVYGRKTDFCWLYGLETTDSMDMVDK